MHRLRPARRPRHHHLRRVRLTSSKDIIMSNDIVDANGALHAGDSGRFTGHLQSEADPGSILGRESALAREFIAQFGNPFDALRALATEAEMAVHYQDRGVFDGHLDRELTDEEWGRIKPHLEDYDEWLDNSGATESMYEWRSQILEKAGVSEWPDEDEDCAGGPTYEKCAHCHLFVEPNDDATGDPALAAYLHLHRGTPEDEELDSSHEASPSGDIRTLAEWKLTGPPEMIARFTS